MGLFEEVNNTVGMLALSKRGWRILALASIAIIVATAFGMERLVVYTVYADRQTFIDRDTSNAAAAKVAIDKANLVDLSTTKAVKLIADRTDTLEKEYIELRTEYQTDARWIRQTMQKWDTPAPPPTPK
jgi:hypothetical protein